MEVRVLFLLFIICSLFVGPNEGEITPQPFPLPDRDVTVPLINTDRPLLLLWNGSHSQILNVSYDDGNLQLGTLYDLGTSMNYVATPNVDGSHLFCDPGVECFHVGFPDPITTRLDHIPSSQLSMAFQESYGIEEFITDGVGITRHGNDTLELEFSRDCLSFHVGEADYFFVDSAVTPTKESSVRFVRYRNGFQVSPTSYEVQSPPAALHIISEEPGLITVAMFGQQSKNRFTRRDAFITYDDSEFNVLLGGEYPVGLNSFLYPQIVRVENAFAFFYTGVEGEGCAVSAATILGDTIYEGEYVTRDPISTFAALPISPVGILVLWHTRGSVTKFIEMELNITLPTMTDPITGFTQTAEDTIFNTSSTSITSTQEIDTHADLGFLSSPGVNTFAMIVGVTITVTLFLIALIVFISLVVMRRRREESSEEDIELHTMGNAIVRKLNHLEVEVGERIGDGNFGIVYKGNWKGQVVALKEPKDPKYLRSFFQEAEVGYQFAHPNCIKIYGIVTYKQGPIDRVLFVMEYASERSLSRVLSTPAAREWVLKDFLQIALDTCEGMSYLEDRGIIHGDLSCRNLLVHVDDNGKRIIKIGDFGLSKSDFVYHSDLRKETEPINAREMPIRWTAPEVLLKISSSTKSDVWSFGALLWELFNLGETPYKNLDVRQIKEGASEGNLEALQETKRTPSGIIALIHRCMNFEPTKRPTWGEIKVDLESLQRKTNTNV